jgi:acyl-CoA reductase-like NAD-dependent aldehyde dehydrogenase
MGTPFSITSPIDGSQLVAGNYLSFLEAEEKLRRAEQAQRAWRDTSVPERVAVLRRFLDAFDRHADEFARQVSVAMGKPIRQAQGEIAGMRTRAEALCWQAPMTLADQTLPERDHLERFIRREPLGVVLDIAAWNYPYVVAINVIAPAILAGNAVLVKHAPQTACVGRQFEQAFVEAGAPEGLVQDLMVDHSTVSDLLRTRRIAHVGFTGSVRGGHEVYSQVGAAGFASCGLEMGGKDAAVVLDDADVSETAVALCDGAFYNAGQSCCAVERIYVPQKMLGAFVDAFVSETHRLRLGHPLEESTTLGPVVSKEAAERINAQVASAVARGARVVSDDRMFYGIKRSECYLPPRVLLDVDHSMDLMVQESFGPVIGIMPYPSETEALQLANESRYGLTASVWTKDHERALAFADRLQVGTVYMNRCDAVDPDLPWVGTKESGLGCTLSHLGILSMTRPKSFNFKLAGSK